MTKKIWRDRSKFWSLWFAPRPLRIAVPPHFRLFSIQWWPQIINMSEWKWPKKNDTTNFVWPKKKSFVFDLLVSHGAPGGPRIKNRENYFLRLKNYDFYEKMGRKSGNHEWNDLGISSETTWESRVKWPGNHEWIDLGYKEVIIEIALIKIASYNIE